MNGIFNDISTSLVNSGVLSELEHVLRIIVAGGCGVLIGIERKNRLKSAGIKTHLLVALASALMVVISKYGFMDILNIEGLSVDASRVASSVVSGVGFLGAGLILVGKREIIGVTTAAGIWATVGVGMALGAGMYFLGIASTAIILVSQFLLHKRILLTKEYFGERVCAVLSSGASLERLHKTLGEHGFELFDIKAKTTNKNLLEVRFIVRVKGPENVSQLADVLHQSEVIENFSLSRIG